MENFNQNNLRWKTNIKNKHIIFMYTNFKKEENPMENEEKEQLCKNNRKKRVG